MRTVLKFFGKHDVTERCTQIWISWRGHVFLQRTTRAFSTECKLERLRHHMELTHDCALERLVDSRSTQCIFPLIRNRLGEHIVYKLTMFVFMLMSQDHVVLGDSVMLHSSPFSKKMRLLL